MSSDKVKKVITSLNKKPSIRSCIPVKVLIYSVDTYLPIFADIINSATRNGTFYEDLKLPEFSIIVFKHTMNHTFLFWLLAFTKITTSNIFS